MRPRTVQEIQINSSTVVVGIQYVTILAVLKYPVSNPPSWAEISNLPGPVFERWYHEPFDPNAFDNPNYRQEFIVKLLLEYEDE
jgi:hypothetical protein